MSLVSRFVFPFVAAAAGTLVLTAGCSRKPATEYVTGFSTQVQVPKEFQTLEVSLWASASAAQPPSLVECHRVEVVNGVARLPKTLGVYEDTGNPNMMVAVTGYTDPLSKVLGRFDCSLNPGKTDGLNPRVLRRSRQNYRDGKILYLPMPLKYACFDTSCNCAPGQVSSAENPCDVPGDQQSDVTCVAGKCVTGVRDSRIFKEYSPEVSEGASSTCFSVKQCLTDAAVPKLEDAATCTYSVAGSLEGLNVRVVYDGYVTEVLDVDPPIPEGADDALKKDMLGHEEGYTVLGPGKFRLAKNLCDSMSPTSKAAHKILAVVASRQCPAKNSNQPLCAENSEVLIPAASKLYVLLDRSLTMNKRLQGKDAIDQVLGISLNDPVFSTTEVAFRWFPEAGTATCPAAPDYATKLDVPFTLALKARDAIVEKIKSQNDPARPTPPATASAERALSAGGAYVALTSLPDANKLNRRAVVVITNNDLGLSCTGAPAPSIAQAASEALAKGVSTYAIELGQEGQTDETNPQQIARADSCEKLAKAGGTERCYNAGSGTQENAAVTAGRALSKIVADLSSCLYLRPSSVADASTAKIAIVAGPIGYLEVKHDEACKPSTAAAGADGWNFEGADGSLIRICGGACSQIRDTLLRASALAAEENIKAGNASAPLARQPIFVTSIVDKK